MSARPARRRRVASVRTDGRTDGVRERDSSAARLTHRARATRVCVSRYRHTRHLVTSPRSAAPAGIRHASTLIVVQQQGYRNDPPRRRVSYARSAAGGPGRDPCGYGRTPAANFGFRGTRIVRPVGRRGFTARPDALRAGPGARSVADRITHTWDVRCAARPRHNSPYLAVTCFNREE